MQDNNTVIEFIPPGAPKPKRWPRILLFVVIIFMLTTTAGIVGYQLQRSEARAQQQALQQQIDDLKRKNSELEKEQKEAVGGSSQRDKAYEVKITQLGVKLSVPGTLKGLGYVYGVNNQGQKAAVLTSESLSLQCADDSTGDPPLGVLTRVNGRFTAQATPPDAVKQFSDFYIMYKAPDQNCSPTAAAVVEEIQAEQTPIIKAAIEKMETL